MVMQEIKKTREMEKFHCYILFEEVKEKVRMLKSYGIGDDEIDTLLHDDEIFPKLTITKDYKIVIGEENQSEIEMEPLVKAIYLLFLSHPEGAEKSIMNATNPVQNSINEKCARIRKAFSYVLPQRLVKYYAISGKRGEVKKIALQRDRIIWEVRL